MHSVLFFGGGSMMCEGFFCEGSDLGGLLFRDPCKNPRSLSNPKDKKLKFCCCTVHLRGGLGCVKIFFGGMWVRGGKTMDLRSSQNPRSLSSSKSLKF